MTGDYLTTTQSTCRECRKLIPARIYLRPDGVWFSKICPDHGTQDVRVYSDPTAYLKLSHFHRQASMPLKFLQDTQGCPDSCGLCSDHEQHVCLPIIEIYRSLQPAMPDLPGHNPRPRPPQARRGRQVVL